MVRSGSLPAAAGVDGVVVPGFCQFSETGSTASDWGPGAAFAGATGTGAFGRTQDCAPAEGTIAAARNRMGTAFRLRKDAPRRGLREDPANRRASSAPDIVRVSRNGC